jgi:hypothetical protein
MRVSVESWKQVWCRSHTRISFRTELLGQFGENEVWLVIPLRLGLNFNAAKIFVQFYAFGQNQSRKSN